MVVERVEEEVAVAKDPGGRGDRVEGDVVRDLVDLLDLLDLLDGEDLVDRVDRVDGEDQVDHHVNHSGMVITSKSLILLNLIEVVHALLAKEIQ